eukprot:Skav203597  [mRNA]  locus=scaffold935:260366:261079:+ [translate_table: standard]
MSWWGQRHAEAMKKCIGIMKGMVNKLEAVQKSTQKRIDDELTPVIQRSFKYHDKDDRFQAMHPFVCGTSPHQPRGKGEFMEVFHSPNPRHFSEKIVPVCVFQDNSGTLTYDEGIIFFSNFISLWEPFGELMSELNCAQVAMMDRVDSEAEDENLDNTKHLAQEKVKLVTPDKLHAAFKTKYAALKGDLLVKNGTRIGSIWFMGAFCVQENHGKHSGFVDTGSSKLNLVLIQPLSRGV